MAIVKRFSCDDETGEVVTLDIDQETGEPIFEKHSPLHIESTVKLSHKSKQIRFPHGPICNSKRYQSLKEKIIGGYNPTSHQMLLIPSLLIFPGLFCVMLALIEVYLHVKCHRKNKILNDPNVYYRSPFHIVTSTFCAVCREDHSACKVGQLQDQRRDRYDYIRGLAI